jgi:periplasmic protein TonB
MIARVLSLGDETELRDVLRWMLAALIMLAAHVGIVGTIMLLHRPDPAASGAPVVLIELAPAPAAPSEQKLDMPNEQETPPAPPVEQTEPAQPEEQQAVPEEPTAIEPPPPPVMAPMPEAVLPPPKPIEHKQHKPEHKPERKKTPPKSTPSAPSHAAAPAAPQVAPSAAASAAQASWRERLIAHLLRYKRYPAGAQSRREQGTATLSFSIDRNGHVLARSLAHGSGFAELDAEVLAMIVRAQPLPPFPPSMTQARMSFTVPIRFRLR